MLNRFRAFRVPRGVYRVLWNLIALGMLLTAGAAQSYDLPGPTGPVLLTVTEASGGTDRQDGVAFDAAMLAALPQHRIETSTPWTDGKNLFEGVLLADVIDFVGAGEARSFRAVALNEYEIVTSVAEAIGHGALLAMRMDGKPLTRRDKGPIWIVYPRDDNPEIQDERHDAKWVWQLTRIELQ